jgi:DNA modification methylase
MDINDPFTLHAADARDMSFLMSFLGQDAEPLDCTITSPPYWNIKDYDLADQIGFGQSYDEYLAAMGDVFRQLYDHTKPTGSFWMVVDTLRVNAELPGQAARQLPLPFELSSLAAKSGWTLREVVIWKKDRTLPWSTGRRFRNLFEYVLFLVKTDAHKFKVDRLRDFDFGKWWLKWPERYNPNGRQPSNVWEIPIPVQGSWRTPTISHVCPLPEELVKRMVLLSTDPGDVVFDPFAGTGVVLSVANALGRKAAGLDIEPAYAQAFSDRGTESELEVSGSEARAAAVRKMLIQLRALKYPKVMFQRLIRSTSHPPPQSILVSVGRIDGKTLRDGRSAPVRVDITFAYSDADGIDLGEITESLRAFAARPPLSKFGVAASVEASLLKSVDDQLLKRRLHVYEAGHTWVTRNTVRGLDEIRRLETPVARRNHYSYPPIVSNVQLLIADMAASPEQSIAP